MMQQGSRIAAVVLAAGRSRRMGQPKLLLPWGSTTVIAHIVSTLSAAGVEPVVVVTGAEHVRIAAALENSPSKPDTRLVPNPDFAQTEMLASLQVGIRALNGVSADAALVVLGDQPTISTRLIGAVVSAYQPGSLAIIVPSFQMRRGHPWLISRGYWDELLAMGEDQNPRDFLEAHKTAIQYVLIDAPETLQDMDTPEDYKKLSGSETPSEPV